MSPTVSLGCFAISAFLKPAKMLQFLKRKADNGCIRRAPSANEIAQKVVASLPSGVLADEVAQKVLASLPANPTAQQIAQEINNQLSTKTANVPAEYSTATIVIIVAVIAALAIGIVNLFLVRKRK